MLTKNNIEIDRLLTIIGNVDARPPQEVEGNDQVLQNLQKILAKQRTAQEEGK